MQIIILIIKLFLAAIVLLYWYIFSDIMRIPIGIHPISRDIMWGVVAWLLFSAIFLIKKSQIKFLNMLYWTVIVMFSVILGWILTYSYLDYGVS